MKKDLIWGTKARSSLLSCSPVQDDVMSLVGRCGKSLQSSQRKRMRYIVTLKLEQQRKRGKVTMEMKSFEILSGNECRIHASHDHDDYGPREAATVGTRWRLTQRGLYLNIYDSPVEYGTGILYGHC